MGARCLRGPIPCGTAAAGASTMTGLSSDSVPLSGVLHLQSSPVLLPADQQQIYREKVSKLQLGTLHAMETKPTLMPEFLLPPQTILVSLCLYKQSKTPMSQRLPGQGPRSWGLGSDSIEVPPTGMLPAFPLHAVRFQPRLGVCPGWGCAVELRAGSAHPAAVRGNLCSSTALPVSSLWANFNHHVAAVCVTNLTLLSPPTSHPGYCLSDASSGTSTRDPTSPSTCTDEWRGRRSPFLPYGEVGNIKM